MPSASLTPGDGSGGSSEPGSWPWGMSASLPVHFTTFYALYSRMSVLVMITGGIIHDTGAGEGSKSKDFKFEFEPKFKSSAVPHVPQ